MISKFVIGIVCFVLLVSSVGCDKQLVASPDNGIPALNLNNPPKLELQPVRWVVITPDNIDAVIADYKNKNLDLVFFALSDREYQNLSMNMVFIRNYVLQQQVIIKAYRDYYEPTIQKD